MENNILKEINTQREILNKLILLNSPYKVILNQSQKLDKYINLYVKKIKGI